MVAWMHVCHGTLIGLEVVEIEERESEGEKEE